jgi:hypothetical protein
VSIYDQQPQEPVPGSQYLSHKDGMIYFHIWTGDEGSWVTQELGTMTEDEFKKFVEVFPKLYENAIKGEQKQVNSRQS